MLDLRRNCNLLFIGKQWQKEIKNLKSYDKIMLVKKLTLLPAQRILLIGDTITIILVTLIGFASHGELGTAGSRMLTTFIPLTLAWFIVSPFYGVYDLEYSTNINHLWRPALAMIVSAPFAAWLRGLLLNSPILLVFVFVLGGFSVLAIIIWRILFILIKRRMISHNG
jgi:hypothetical protein